MKVFQYKDLPTDTITDIVRNGNTKYVSSWDGNVYVYNHNQLVHTYEYGGPILKLVMCIDVVSADIAGNIYFANNKMISTNTSCIHMLETHNGTLYVGGLDKSVKLLHNDASISTHEVGAYVYGSVIHDNILALNHGNKVCLYDVRNFNVVKTVQNAGIIRALELKDGKIYIGDVDGKITIFRVDTNESIIINAHIKHTHTTKYTYPVNAIISEEYLYSCGSDGYVYRWNENDKMRCRPVFKNDIGILKMLKDGNEMTICSGYNYEKGQGSTLVNSIFVIDI